MPKPLKSAMSTAEHIELLRARGMAVDDQLAHQWLANVSYYRLSAYWYPARVVDAATGIRTDRFCKGTAFTDVTDLYEADRKLRTLVHDGLERIEVALRTRLIEHLCRPGPLAYRDASQFRPTFPHAAWLATAEKRVARAKRHNESIKHYSGEYGAFPFWVLAEVLDFADLSRLFEGLPSKAQHEISTTFNIHVDRGRLSPSQRSKAQKEPPLVRWMEHLTVVRNTCAHHARLWNKSFTPAPTAALRTQPGLELLPHGQNERVFGTLVLMSHLLRCTSPGTSWPLKVAALLEATFLPNPLVGYESLGIPENWNHHL